MDNPILPTDGFPVQPLGGDDKVPSKPAKEGAQKVNFEDVLRGTIQNVDKLQHDASEAVQKMELGESQSFAEVMTAVEKADIAFRTLMQIRNKLVDAYDEIRRMRI